MIARPTVTLDERDAARIVTEVLARRFGYLPQWRPLERGADAALIQITARYLQAIIQRLNQAPEKNKLAFLDLLGLALVPATPARAPVVFAVADGAPDAQAPAGSQLAAPPPPGATDPIVFETETATGVTAAKLKQIVTLWPGRDQYLDHTEPFLAGQPIQLFRKPLLQDTPHAIYLAHDALLAIAGTTTLDVEFELTQTSSDRLRISWQYWDGAVWRSFKSAKPACSQKDAENADSTQGLTRSGRYLLESDCAQSSKRAVNGIEAFWIRGQLSEPLLPDPGQALPFVDRIRLASIITNPLKGTLSGVIRENKPFGMADSSRISGVVANEAGQPLEGVAVKITSPDDDNFEQVTLQTDKSDPTDATVKPGHYDSRRDEGGSTVSIASQSNYELQVAFLALQASFNLRNLDDERDITLDLTFNVDGLDPDKAFSDGTELDLTKPFYPFGQQPQPGSTFYFSSKEVFTKPGAKVQLYVARTATPQDKVEIAQVSQGSGPVMFGPGAGGDNRELDHLIDWEYWNGTKWVILFQSSASNKPAADLDTTELIEFQVPDDIVPTKVNDEEALWMRARLVRGGFGFTQRVTWLDGAENNNEFTYVIDKPPSVAAFRLGYSWTYGLFHPEHVITHNDFQYEDHTFEATWPGATFLPFRRVRDVTPALYLGFDTKLPVDRVGLYFDIVEEKAQTLGPALVWEYFEGAVWRELSVADETRNLRLPGIVSFIGAEDSQPLARFDTELNWVRARLKEDGPPDEPTVNSLFTNAVWATQQQTVVNAPLGASDGLPNQILFFTQIPVLAGERIEVQELSGARANVEWRLVALSIARGDRNIVRDLEEMLSSENAQTDLVKGDLRLVRDRNKKVAEVWVRWYEQPHLFYSSKEDRHYVIDRARGLIFFGDGVKGKIPPAGSAIFSRVHRAGGGLAGNVAARSINQILGPVPGVQSVANARAAEGGADGETIESLSIRGPLTIRHRGRALTPSDYETLAHEASPAVAIARAIPTRNAGGQTIAGWVTLLIIPQSKEPQPWPSFGLRYRIRKYIEERAPAETAAAAQIYVTGPDYLAVGVNATIAPIDAAEAGTVETRARQALEEFLHPLRGGPDRKGWDLGRDLFLSDIAAVLERVEGLDYVKELELLIDGVPQGESVSIADDRVVVAGTIRLKLKENEA